MIPWLHLGVVVTWPLQQYTTVHKHLVGETAENSILCCGRCRNVGLLSAPGAYMTRWTAVLIAIKPAKPSYAAVVAPQWRGALPDENNARTDRGIPNFPGIIPSAGTVLCRTRSYAIFRLNWEPTLNSTALVKGRGCKHRSRMVSILYWFFLQ